MRKIIGICMLCVLCLCLCSCKGSDTTGKTKHVSADGKVDEYKSVQELENDAEAILKVIRLGEEDPVVKKNADGDIYSAYTFSNVKIEKVYKDVDEKLVSGDTITILENEALDEETNTVFHVNGYNMMKKGKEYILFLKKGETDRKEYYVSLGVNYGTVSLEKDGRSVVMKDEEGKKLSDFSPYQEIWEAVRAKYR